MMSGFVFALWYFLAQSALGSKLLFRVDVIMPQEGRNETSDINFIQTTLMELTGIEVVIAVKAFDNQGVILKTEEICHWSSMTTALSKQGYNMSVTLLQSCSDYAADLGVEINYSPTTEIKQFDILELYDVIFSDEGEQTDSYISMIQKSFKRDKLLLKGGLISVCFRSLGNLPVRLMYFNAATSEQLKEIYKKVRLEGKASIEMSLLQSLQMYSNKC